MELILDYSTWRCGGNEPNNQLGKEETSMYNKEGFSCCLGQFTPQLNPEILITEIANIGTPLGVFIKTKKVIPFLVENNQNSDLSVTAMLINDNEYTSPQQKIDALTSLFKSSGHTIKVINQP